MKLAILLCLVGVAVAVPPVTKTREQIESFRNFLESTRRVRDDGYLLDQRMVANPQGNAWQNSGKFQGDMLLNEEQIEALVADYSGVESRNAYIYPNTRWPQNTVVYEIPDGTYPTMEYNQVMAAIRDIERHTCIRFRLKTDADTNFVRLTSRPDGCYAHIGYWSTRGVHILNLSRGCFLHTTIVHEWLHIIGFLHMQSTHNRDDYVRILWENIFSGQEHNFEKFNTSISNNLGLPYEYTSCMHYPSHGFSSNGRPTIEALRSFQGVMGQQQYVTDLDWLRANRHYNCPGAWSTSVKEEVVMEEIMEDDLNV